MCLISLTRPKDRGGMKGYGGMQMLLTIQELYFKEKGRDLFNQFDFIAGTSIGGVTALGAADLNTKGWSTDKIRSLKGRGMIDEARDQISWFVKIVKSSMYYNQISTNPFDKSIVFQQCIPLASSSSDMRLYQAMAATSVAPVVFDSVKTEVDDKKRILGDGGLFQNCPMSLALDEVSRLYPTRPLGVILNIGYGPEEEALINRIIDTARLVHPNLHYQRIAPRDVFKDFSPAEIDIQVITDMEKKVEHFIQTTPRVQNALKVA